MSNLLRLVSMTVLVAVTACASIQIRTDYDESVDFSVLHTFAWVEPPKSENPQPFIDNTLLRKRVRDAVEAELIRKGYRSAAREDADFLATFSVTLLDRTRGASYGASGGYYGGYHGFGIGLRSHSAVSSYQEGTLIVDVLDAKTEQLIWRGWALDAVPTTDRSQERIELAITRVFERFGNAAAP